MVIVKEHIADRNVAVEAEHQVLVCRDVVIVARVALASGVKRLAHAQATMAGVGMLPPSSTTSSSLL